MQALQQDWLRPRTELWRNINVCVKPNLFASLLCVVLVAEIFSKTQSSDGMFVTSYDIIYKSTETKPSPHTPAAFHADIAGNHHC